MGDGISDDGKDGNGMKRYAISKVLTRWFPRSAASARLGNDCYESLELVQDQWDFERPMPSILPPGGLLWMSSLHKL